MSKLIVKVVDGIGVALSLVIIVALGGLLHAVPIYFLWNWLMPDIFGLKQITFWQAWGICALSGLLFKSSNSSNGKRGD